jgi:plastocyanin
VLPAIVQIKNVDFTPHVLTVERDTRVTWEFRDPDVSHRVKSRGAPAFKSSGFRRDGTYSVTFGDPGTYRYRCTIHPNMKARIVVG